ncbi:MAG: FRG domain-containing protein [Methanotrichaceae archaeon]|nr:FRG domain-containing protein [Methanotrichaceae archaeon]
MKLPSEINSINDALKIGASFSHGWFRGHDQAYNNLNPKVFRNDYPPHYEFYFIQKFKIHAPIIAGSVPDSRDFLSWLVLAQHFGLPTRLLDWTESILIALWFSVNSIPTPTSTMKVPERSKKNTARKEKDCAELWAMDPASLNKHHKNEYLHDDIALSENLLVQYLAEQPMVREESMYQEKVKNDWKESYGQDFEFPKYPIAFMPQKTFQRQASQLSVFTIHPKPDGNSIEHILHNRTDLSRFTIPEKSKEKLRKDLSDLGITKRMLFYDLESISYDIIKEVPR